MRACGTAEDPEAYAESFVERILPAALPHEIGTPASYGSARWIRPTLTDNAPDVLFSLAAAPRRHPC